MLTRWRLGTPVRLSLLFVLIAGTLLGALAWLWQSVLAEERRDAERRQIEQLASAATLVSHDLERALEAWQALAISAIADDSRTPPADSAILVFDADGVARTSGVPLPFLPAVPAPARPSSPELDLAAVHEYQIRDLSGAANLYRQASTSPDPSIRATALVGLARVRRRQHQTQSALAAYADLATMNDVSAAGFPARLLAHRERSSIFREMGDEPKSRAEVAHLRAALMDGSVRVDRSTFDLFLEFVSAELPDTPGCALADAAVEFWPHWQQQSAGRSTAVVGNQAFLTVWDGSGSRAAAVIAPLAALMASTQTTLADLGVVALVNDQAGAPVWGDESQGLTSTTPLVSALGVPWTLSVATTGEGASTSGWLTRGSLISAGFLLMALVIGAASYAVFRSVNRELAVARLQSDFVAAVSHEFRSPLTAMRHLTDVLEEGGASSQQLPRYYEALGKETRRLHGLVEHLLDFGRVQTGRQAYHLELDDAVDLARAVVEEFRPHATEAEHDLVFSTAVDDGPIRVDRDALSLALRNLVDNAVKYSPAGSTVRVLVESNGVGAAIAVEDHGAGVPAEEQRRIFDQFVRGSSAVEGHVKGTGIGLTMAARIVHDHGGKLDLRSTPGDGTTFRILLPIVEREADAEGEDRS